MHLIVQLGLGASPRNPKVFTITYGGLFMLTKEKLTLQDILGDPISRDEAYDIICSSPIALQLFNGLSIERQDDILDFIQGNKGLPILYDGFLSMF